MRYGIFSDTHSNLEALDAVIQAYKKEAIDKYFCLGDIVGYAANPNECVGKVKGLADVTVAGNHDWASVGFFSLDNFNPLVKEAVLWTKQHLNEESRYFLNNLKLYFKNEDLTLVHGTLKNPQDFDYLVDRDMASETFALLETKACFVGHTHVAGVFIRDLFDNLYFRQGPSVGLKEHSNYIINVGSVGQPRDGDPRASFCIYDTEEKVVYLKRVEYDFQETKNKIIGAGLPGYLGERLLAGK